MTYENPVAQTRAALSCWRSLKDELEGSLFRSVPGYYAKYFPDAVRQTTQRESPEAQAGFTDHSAQSSSPLVESCSDLLNLLVKLSSDRTDLSSNKFILLNANEIALVANTVSPQANPLSDAVVLVLGLFQPNSDPSSDDSLLSFCDRVSKVFAARPDRFFLHAFRFQNGGIETWTFDRAGAYSGSILRVKSQPHLFRQIMIGYLSMDHNHLGLNPTSFGVEHQKFVEINDSSQNKRFEVEAEAFVKQDDLIGPGTSCFKACSTDSMKRPLVVKFAWTPSELPAEWKLLQFVKNRNVWGIVRLEGHQYLCDIETLRQGLHFGQPYSFTSKDCDDDNGATRTKSSQPKSKGPSQVLPSVDSETHESISIFENLKFECIVTSPLGRPLDSFSSPLELIKILHDAVKALQSLYLEASIIHRDISTQNIIIVPANEPDAGSPVGMLIDLNLALDISNPPEKEDLVGSEGFMAIGILGGDNATYRHDLESVFYVFLWLAICHNGKTSKNIPAKSRLHAWCGTDWLASFHAKRRDMQPNTFPIWIEDEFTDLFKPYLPLASDLHRLLFPIRNGKIFIGTDLGPLATKQLYADMMMAFNTAAISLSRENFAPAL